MHRWRAEVALQEWREGLTDEHTALPVSPREESAIFGSDLERGE
jgi:hypothetical protein